MRTRHPRRRRHADATLANSVNATDLGPGTYTITQAAVPNWALSSLTCDTGETTDLANRRATIDLTAGEHTTCTFTNTSASITIVESSYVADAHDFTYTGCLGSGCSTFALDDDNDPALPDRGGAAGLAPGTYVITQAADPNWKLTSITCTTGETVNLANRQVTVRLTAGEQQTCKFSNDPPSLAISQRMTPEAPQAFDYTGCLGNGCGAFTLDRDPATAPPTSRRVQVLATGTYVITQAPNANWPLTSITCTNGETVDLPNRRVTITLTAGERQACQFTNTSPSLTLIEDTVPDGPQDVTLHRCQSGDCTHVVLDDDSDQLLPATSGPTPLAAGTYVVTADQVPGYELASLTCPTETVELDQRTATITLGATEQQTCTFVHRPVDRSPISGVAQMGTGLYHSCARLVSGQVRCWGADDSGQLGDEGSSPATSPQEVLAPGGIGPLEGVRDLAVGSSHSCAVLGSGEVRCWGLGALGRPVGWPPFSSLPGVVENGAGTGALSGIAQVTAGQSVSCGLETTGRVVCWGANGSGELGDGTTTSSTRPVAVSDPAGTGRLGDVEQITGSMTHHCARQSTGEVRCWGGNSEGQLGDGTTSARSRPIAVLAEAGAGSLSGVSQVSAGYTHTCAVLASGEARCWGRNDEGQLGDGTTTDRARPIAVRNTDGTGPLTGVVEILAGADHSCARLVDGGLSCWGYGHDGALGNGDDQPRLLPTPVVDDSDDLDSARSLAGDVSTCAVIDGGQVRCWGRNADGQLGDGTREQRRRPVAVLDPRAGLAPLDGVEEVGSGSTYACARTGVGSVWCWGAGRSGELGTPLAARSPVPVAVRDADGDGTLAAVQLSVGDQHACAVLVNHRAACWGSNRLGQLGDGTTADHAVPTVVRDPDGNGALEGVQQISAGDFHTCAALADSTAVCWGTGDGGVLGDGTSISRLLPVAVVGVSGDGPLDDVVEIAAGGAGTCARLASGGARCWGRTALGVGPGTTGSNRPLVVLDPSGGVPLSGVAAIVRKDDNACALMTDTTARCWGTNDDGQLGVESSTAVVPLPSVVRNEDHTGPLSGVLDLALGPQHSCAVLAAGGARCWGTNTFGTVGDGTTSNRPRPTPVSDIYAGASLGGVRQMDPGDRFTCAVLTGGEIRCWGYNVDGALGDGEFLETSSGYQNIPVRLRPRVVLAPPG